MDNLKAKVPTLKGTKIQGKEITNASVFCYTDPVTHEVADNQGICVNFKDGRIVLRLSGTSSSGASLRVYFNKKVRGKALFHQKPDEAMADFLDMLEDLSDLKRLTGVQKPSMIT